jgi:hypothetical protein
MRPTASWLQRAAGNQAVNDLLASDGQKLPPALRQDFEQRFGMDFGAVRIHHTPRASDAANALAAKAFTVGTHIAFGPGRFVPDSTDGKRLLAHELTHVVQQSRGGTTPPTLDGSGPLEADAETAAAAAGEGGGPIAVAGAGAVGIAASPDPAREKPGEQSQTPVTDEQLPTALDPDGPEAELDRAIGEVDAKFQAQGEALAQLRKERLDYYLKKNEERVRLEIPVDAALKAMPAWQQTHELEIRVLEVAFGKGISREDAELVLRRMKWSSESRENRTISEQIATADKTIPYYAGQLRIAAEMFNEIDEDRARASRYLDERLNCGPDMALEMFKDVGRSYWNGLVGFGQGIADLPKAPQNLIHILRGEEPEHIFDLSELRARYRMNWGRDYGGAAELGVQIPAAILSGKLVPSASNLSQASQTTRLFWTWMKINVISAGATPVVQTARDIVRFANGEHVQLTSDDVLQRIAAIALFGHAMANAAAPEGNAPTSTGGASSAAGIAPDLIIDQPTATTMRVPAGDFEEPADLAAGASSDAEQPAEAAPAEEDTPTSGAKSATASRPSALAKWMQKLAIRARLAMRGIKDADVTPNFAAGDSPALVEPDVAATPAATSVADPGAPSVAEPTSSSIGETTSIEASSSATDVGGPSATNTAASAPNTSPMDVAAPNTGATNTGATGVAAPTTATASAAPDSGPNGGKSHGAAAAQAQAAAGATSAAQQKAAAPAAPKQYGPIDERSFAESNDIIAAQGQGDFGQSLQAEQQRLAAQPATPRRGLTYEQARAEADAGAANARRVLGMTDPNVQAGHTQAARHSAESGAPRAQVNDPRTFQQLHSRRNQGLDVTVTDPTGLQRTTTRHRSQELLIDDAAAKARARTGGRLTPEGQEAAGREVQWRTEGTGYDQREVNAKRASGLFNEAQAIENSQAVRDYRARKAAQAKAAATPPGGAPTAVPADTAGAPATAPAAAPQAASQPPPTAAPSPDTPPEPSGTGGPAPAAPSPAPSGTGGPAPHSPPPSGTGGPAPAPHPPEPSGVGGPPPTPRSPGTSSGPGGTAPAPEGGGPPAAPAPEKPTGGPVPPLPDPHPTGSGPAPEKPAPEKKSPSPAQNELSKAESALHGTTAALNRGAAAVRTYDAYEDARKRGDSVPGATLEAGKTYLENTNVVAGALANYEAKKKDGQDPIEAALSAGGETIGQFIVPGKGGDQAINAVDNLAGALDDHQKRADPAANADKANYRTATDLAAGLTPSRMFSGLMGAGLRSYWDIGKAAGGDPSGVDKFADDAVRGKAAMIIQPWAMAADFLGNLGSGEGTEKALDKTLRKTKGSALEKAGSASGDAMYELGQSDTAKSGQYGAPVQGIAMLLSATSDHIAGKSWEQAFAKAAEPGKDSLLARVGNAGGDAAWAAHEKLAEVTDKDIPAMKAAVQEKLDEAKATVAEFKDEAKAGVRELKQAASDKWNSLKKGAASFLPSW